MSGILGNNTVIVYRQSLKLTQSAPLAQCDWKLRFAKKDLKFVSPVTHCIGSWSVSELLNISFPTIDSAVRYLNERRLSYIIF